MSEKLYDQQNRKTVLNRTKEYENKKEALREKARNEYRELSDEEKNIMENYGRNRSHNTFEEKNRH